MKPFGDIVISALIPKMYRFEFRLALRHLLSGGLQTVLTISAVATGVIIVIFITSLIFGLQNMMSVLLTESIPHVTVQVEDPKPKPIEDPNNPTSSRIEVSASRLKFIDNWDEVVSMLRGLPNVSDVAAVGFGVPLAFTTVKLGPNAFAQPNWSLYLALYTPTAAVYVLLVLTTTLSLTRTHW